MSSPFPFAFSLAQRILSAPIIIDQLHFI